MAVMMASQIHLASRTADYWALHLQTETQTGWKMVERLAIEMKV